MCLEINEFYWVGEVYQKKRKQAGKHDLYRTTKVLKHTHTPGYQRQILCFLFSQVLV
jgi:hypothetical protein